MSKIPYMAAHLEKRSGKEESFNIIKKSINGENLTDYDWAVMYSYFMPPKPKKITNPYEWVSMVCDQKESYSFCKYVQVDDNKTIAANTKVAHILFDNLGLESNWYDIKKGKVGDDVAIMPNVNNALNESGTNDFDFDASLLTDGTWGIIEATTGLSYVLPWNKKGVDKKYFDLMIKSLDNIFVQYSIDGPFKVSGTVSGVKCAAVIMPFKLHGLVDNIVEDEPKYDFKVIPPLLPTEEYKQLSFEDFI